MLNLNWKIEHQTQSYQGQQKQGFTLTFIPDLQSILVFGGSHVKINEVHLYHLVKKIWITQKTFFPKKMSRKYHTAYYQQSIKALVVHGGQAEKGRSLDSIDALFIDDWKWRKLALKNTPPPRQYHSFTKLNSGNYLIFGGITLPYGTFLNDIWVIKGINQIKDSSTLEIPGCTANQVTTNGSKPSGRHSHKGYVFGQYYFIIGGQSQSPEQNLTLFSLHVKKLLWNKHNFNMIIPQLRGFSIIPNTLSTGQIFIFGGIILNGKKNNRQILSINLNQIPKLKHLTKCSNQIPSGILDNCCSLPYQQICGIGLSFTNTTKPAIYKLELQLQNQQLSMQQYLKLIKGQQILSQQLIRKSQNLQLLYRQIQNYISSLYSDYQEHMFQNQEDDDSNNGQFHHRNNSNFNGILPNQQMEIQKQKRQQIQGCRKLKHQYLKIDKIYQDNLGLLKKARGQLAHINENFQGCMETERDQEI